MCVVAFARNNGYDFRDRAQETTMGTFFDGIKRAAKAAIGSLPGQYAVANQTVTCPLCQGREFLEDSATLIAGGMTVHALTCAECSRIEWFADRPLRLDEKPS